MDKNSVSAQVLRSAVHMRAPELAALTEAVRENYEQLKETLVVVPTSKVEFVQGYAKALKDFLELVDEASVLLQQKQT